MIAPSEVLAPSWDAPVGACVSTRAGGVSGGPYASLNLGLAVGDDPAAVAENRRRFAATIGRPPVWLRQVHGTRVVRIGRADVGQAAPEADACWTDDPEVACVVQVADCLPVLLAAPQGRAVAAAHAGWRGLAAGVLENTVAALCGGAGCAPQELWAWTGPCIGPTQFEVGADVLAAFGADPGQGSCAHFRFRAGSDGSPRWLADLPALATERLRALGVRSASAGQCTFSDPSRFFSHRRDGVSGRLGAAVWRLG